MEHQNWNVTILRKKEKDTTDPVTQKHRNGAIVQTDVKIKQNQKPQMYKLDENGDVLQTNKIPLDIAKKIQSERAKSQLTRKELATKLNIKENIIIDIENANYIFDKLLIRKIEKVLNCKII